MTVAGGVETLTGTNTYTGLTTINSGATLAMAQNGSITNSSQVIDNGVFDTSWSVSGVSIKSLSGSGLASLGGFKQTLTITSGFTTFGGVIADGGFAGGTGANVTVAGGTQTLTGVNTYTGATTINAKATLALKGAGSIATSSGVADNGTFDISQTNAGASIKTLSGNGLVSLGGSAQTLTLTAAAADTFSGVIADGGIKSGVGGNLTVSAGTETLTGVNTYTGATTVNKNAALLLVNGGSIATSSVVTANGLVDISGTTSGASFITLAGSGIVNLGAQTLSITKGSTNFAGVMGGTGGLNITGGNQTLSGANLYTGGTAISSGATLSLATSGSIATSSGVMNAGALDISGTNSGASITTLGGAGTVNLGAQYLTITAGGAGANGTIPAGVFSGAIGGAGGVNIAGGHQELTGVSTYAGGTTVTNATLSVASDASLGAKTGGLTLNNATLIADNNLTTTRTITLTGADQINSGGNIVSLNGTITGSGGLVANGGGTFNLTGNNTYTGGTLVGLNTTLTTTGTGGVGSGPVEFQTLTGGVQNLYTGSIHVSGPLDFVNTLTGPELIIRPGDTLVGVGTINAPVLIQTGGTSAPGDGPGTIVVTSSVTNLAGSTARFDIDGALSSVGCANPLGCAGQYSSLILTGASSVYTAAGVIAPNLRGIGAPANNNYTPAVTTAFNVVQAQGGVVGSFSSLTQPTSGLAVGTRFDALYLPNNIILYVTPSNYQDLSPWSVKLAANEYQVAGALNALRGAAGPRNTTQATSDFGLLYQIQPQNLPAAFSTLTGEVAADAKFAAFHMMNQYMNVLVDQSVVNPNGSSSRGGNVWMASASVADNGGDLVAAKPSSAVYSPNWTAWGSVFGATGTIAGNATIGSNNMRAGDYGVAAGADYHFDRTAAVGASIAGGQTNWSVAQGLGSGSSQSFLAGVYAAMRFNDVYFTAAASLGNQFVSTSRQALGGDHLVASYNGLTYAGRLEAGYTAIKSTIDVTPFAAIQAQGFRNPTYSEVESAGAGFGLTYNGQNATDVRSEIGTRFDMHGTVSDNLPITVTMRAAWAHDWIGNSAMVAAFNATSLSGAMAGAVSPFIVRGAVPGRDTVLVQVGSEIRLTPSVSIGARLDGGEFGRGVQTYGADGNIRVTW